jgi:hypothetical protein
MRGHRYFFKKNWLLRAPLEYPIGALRGSDKSVLMPYRCVDRKSCVAMAASNTHEKTIAPNNISILFVTPLVECLNRWLRRLSELYRHYSNV